MRAPTISLLALALAFAGCSSCDEPAAAPEEPTPEEPTPEEPTPEPTAQTAAPPDEPTALCADGWCLEDASYAAIPRLRAVGMEPYLVDGPAAYVLRETDVVRFDGEAWTSETHGAQEGPRGRERAYALGGGGDGPPLLLTREGTFFERQEDGTWTRRHSLTLTEPDAIIGHAWLRALDDAWAEVFEAEGRETKLMRWDGERWTAPEPLSPTADHEVALAAEGAVVIIEGDERRSVLSRRTEQGGVEHVPLEGEAPRGIHASADGAVYGVRDDEVVKLEGEAWRTVQRIPAMDRLRSVWAHGDGLAAIGRARSESGSVDTSSLQRVWLRAGGSDSLSDPFDVISDQVLLLEQAVVAYGLDEETYVHTDGAWSVRQPLRAVWAHAPDCVYAVGDGGAIRRFDGERWVDEESPTDADLLAVHGFDATSVFAVGRDGTILRRGDDGWAREDTSAQADLTDVWGADPDHVYVTASAGEGSMVLEDGEWRPVEGRMALTGVVGAGPGGQAFGMTLGGGFEGVQGMPMRTPTPAYHAWYGTLPSPQGTTAEEWITVGTEQVYRLDGDAWVNEPLQGLERGVGPLGDVHGAAGRAIVVGGGGLVWERGAEGWSRRDLPARSRLHAVFALPSGDAWAVGDAGVILHRAP